MTRGEWLAMAVWLAVAGAPASAEMIHLMARKGDVAAVKKLVEDGVPVDLPSTVHTTETGVSPLFIAAKFGKADVVRALLEAGADPTILFRWEGNAYYYGTPLHVAARWGRVEVVDMLLEAGADPARYNSFIGTPLHLARLGGHEAVAARLTAAGAPEQVEQPPIPDRLAGADPENGARIARGCEYCHAMGAGGGGTADAPSLWNVVGRATAAAPAFGYSPAMQALGGSWSFEALNSYLASPYQYLPGTSKIMVGIEDDADRADLIAHLRRLGDDPVPLP